MKNKIIILAFINICAISQTIFALEDASGLTINSKQLADTNARASFIDPHNHIGGVLPPLALVDIEKFLQGDKPNTSELLSFWQTIVKAFNESPKVKGNSRMSNTVKMVMLCDKPDTVCARGLSEDCKLSLQRNIANVLTSSPVTTFWTAYAFRDMVNASIAGTLSTMEAERKKDLVAKANLLELARKNVGLVEMSVNFIGGSRGPSSLQIFTRYANIITELKSSLNAPGDIALKEIFRKDGLTVPRMKWLLMTHTMELGRLPGGKTLNYAKEGQCREMPMPDALDTDPVMGGFYDVLLQVKDVVGVDIAGAENTCFTDEGMDSFKNLAKTVYYAARERQHAHGTKEHLLVRVHVGEGAPILIDPYFADKEQACKAVEEYPEVATAVDDTGFREGEIKRPIHEIEATKNVDYLLGAIADLKQQFPDIDDYVIFRLGHLTHATRALAKKVKDLGVHADVDLSSNISTGASVVDAKVIKKYLIDNGIKADNTDGMIATLLENKAPVEEFITNHGLKWLLFYHVPTLLGSDGSGLENSPSMNQEYFLAKRLIDYWNKTDSQFKRRNISIDDLLYNQQRHYDAMGY